VVVLGDGGEISAALAATLKSRNVPVCQVAPGAALRQVQADRFEADLSSPSAVHEWRRQLSGTGVGCIGGVINALGLEEACRRGGCEDEDLPLRISLWTLNVLKELIGDLCASVEQQGGWYVNLTPLGGKFGLEGGAADAPLALGASGTLGITKSLRREYPSLRVKNVDVDATMDPAILASRILDEVAGDRLSEVGLTRQGRWRVGLQKEAPGERLGPLPLGADSVVLVTGGGQGVTAEIARALAAAARPRLILVGRSALPGPEAPEMAGLDHAALRRLLLERARELGSRVVPAEVERSVSRVLKDRRIRATLEACTAAGARVEYHGLDVRDAARLGELIDDIYERHGRIDGVIHGAGVIDDRLLPDKTPESFAWVFATKVASAMTLARKLRPEGLKFVVFLGSVSARFGNPGQVDYSAANEVLNKLADDLARRWPARVVSINWGPWNEGMVVDPARDLRWAYSQAGLQLIEVPEGTEACLNELRRGRTGGSEVLIAASVERLIDMSKG
jgi:NAD(P)-dependent dehydrogenase (short-subunit alcohol dehydrogenase family)